MSKTINTKPTNCYIIRKTGGIPAHTNTSITVPQHIADKYPDTHFYFYEADGELIYRSGSFPIKKVNNECNIKY